MKIGEVIIGKTQSVSEVKMTTQGDATANPIFQGAARLFFLLILMRMIKECWTKMSKLTFVSG